MDSKLTLIIFNRTRDPQSFALFVVICHPLIKPQILIKDLTKSICNIDFNFLQNQQPFLIKYLEYDLSVQPTSISTDDGAMAYRFRHVVPTNFCLDNYVVHRWIHSAIFAQAIRAWKTKTFQSQANYSQKYVVSAVDLHLCSQVIAPTFKIQVN